MLVVVVLALVFVGVRRWRTPTAEERWNAISPAQARLEREYWNHAFELTLRKVNEEALPESESFIEDVVALHTDERVRYDNAKEFCLASFASKTEAQKKTLMKERREWDNQIARRIRGHIGAGSKKWGERRAEAIDRLASDVVRVEMQLKSHFAEMDKARRYAKRWGEIVYLREVQLMMEKPQLGSGGSATSTPGAGSTPLGAIPPAIPPGVSAAVPEPLPLPPQ
jgi:hypothetical protein